MEIVRRCLICFLLVRRNFTQFRSMIPAGTIVYEADKRWYDALALPGTSTRYGTSRYLFFRFLAYPFYYHSYMPAGNLLYCGRSGKTTVKLWVKES